MNLSHTIILSILVSLMTYVPAQASARIMTAEDEVGTGSCISEAIASACALPLLIAPTAADEIEDSFDRIDQDDAGFDDAFNHFEDRNGRRPLAKPLLRTEPIYAPIFETLRPTVTQ
ncbi:hypothetical protein [Heliomarina baculiformis]|uniref:hypothetical protein n=1 Tax=Heliomarina baculiformis TaxID=2872036 RepID=UPI001EE24B64|nr:hypothetical protein [Heliomarina baculiformis]